MTDTNEGFVNKEEKPINPQRFSWKSVGTFNTYEEAAKKKASLNEKHLKIKRCGANGSVFSVKVGSPVKKKSE